MSDDKLTDPFVGTLPDETTDPLVKTASDEATDPLVQSGAYEYSDREATHLISLDESDAPDDPPPSESFEDEKTHVIFFDDDDDEDAGDSEPSPPPRRDGPQPSQLPPRAPAYSTHRSNFLDRQEFGPTEPDEPDHIGKLAKQHPSDNPSQGRPSEALPPQRESSAHNVVNEQALRTPARKEAVREEARRNNPPGEDSTPSAFAPSRQQPRSGSGQFVRQFTRQISAQARSQFEEAAQSPARAMLVAIITASVVLITGVAALYSALAHTHFDNQMQRVERAIDADMYSSHLAALRDLSALNEHQVIPWEPGDNAVSALIDQLPWLSTYEKRRTADHLETFVQARLEYRFSTPGTFLETPPEANGSQLLAAARIYRKLSLGNKVSAMKEAEEQSLADGNDRFAILAYADTLAKGGTDDQITSFASRFPASTPAEIFLHAQLQYRLDDHERAIEYLEEIGDGDDALHVGARLKLAMLRGDDEAIGLLVEELDSPSHPHVSSIELARAYLLDAEVQQRRGNKEAHQQRLEDAAQRVPLHRDAVQPLIDSLLEQGDLLEARRRLARTPSADQRHHYFDIALGRVHLAIGDLERAEERFARHLGDNVSARAKTGVTKLLASESEAARQIFEALNEEGEPLGAVTLAWLQAAHGESDRALETLKPVQTSELTPLFLSLAADTLRKSSGLATTNDERDQLLKEATSVLADQSMKTPETRRLACLVALDQRDKEAAESTCALIAQRDVAARSSVAAAIRWKTYNGKTDEARRLLEANIDQAGPDTTTRLASIRLSLEQGDFKTARTELDALASRARDGVDFLIAEGHYALARGQLNRAQRHFEQAQEASDLHRTEILLGHIEAQLLAHQYGPDTPSGEVDPNAELEASVRQVLRDGEFGPRAWSLFANLRRQQRRMADATENIGLANTARNDYGSSAEHIHLLSEELAIGGARHGSGDRRLRRTVRRGEDAAVPAWRFHLLAGTWHRRQRRTDQQALLTHLGRARDIAPVICAIWDEIDVVTSRSLRRQLTTSDRPDHC